MERQELALVQAGAAPMATAMVSGVDMDRDGIPDVLQRGTMGQAIVKAADLQSSDVALAKAENSNPPWLVQFFVWLLQWIVALVYGIFWPARRLRFDEQLRVETLQGAYVVPGPGLVFINPFHTATVVKAESLSQTEYVRIKDITTGQERAVAGPRMLFLGPYERVVQKGQGIMVSSMQYVAVQDTHSGERKVLNGPMVWIPAAREEGTVHSCVKLSSTEYVIVQDHGTGEKRVDTGPRLWFPGPHDTWEKGESVWISASEYVCVQDKSSGRRRIDKGPRQWFPGPYDEWKVGVSITLGSTQYITVMNHDTGTAKLVKGPTIWWPGPYDTASDVAEAQVLHEDEFVKIKDMASGNRWIQKGKGLLYLEPTWKVEDYHTRSKGVHKATMLKAREFMRLQVTPHFRITRG
jgi:hypothetical protein